MQKNRNLLIFLAFLCFSVLPLQQASACVHPTPLPFQVVLRQTGPGVYEVDFIEYETFLAFIGQTCVCGLAPTTVPLPFPILNPQFAITPKVLDAQTGLPINGFNFSSNQTTTSGIATLAGRSYAGFSSPITANVSSGQTVFLRFEIVTSPLLDINFMQQFLTGGQVYTDEGNPDGSLKNSHGIFRDINVVQIEGQSCGQNGDKVLVCHKGNTICVAQTAVAAHQAHGDAVGECASSKAGGEADTHFETAMEIAPNPVQNATSISFRLETAGNAQLTLFDCSGRQIATLFDGRAEAGVLQEHRWNVNGHAPGIYFVRLQTDSGKIVHQKLLVR